MKRRIRLSIAAMLLVSIAALPLFAAAAKRGWTKVQLTHADGNSGPFPPGLLEKVGGELLVDYGSNAVGYVPAGAVALLRAEARKEGIAIAQRDDFDVMHLPSSAQVDVREGIKDDVPQEDRIHAYPANKPGLFLIQFIAPARSEWVAELVSMGWTMARYIPTNGYVIAGKPELVERTKQLSYIQFVDFFHPYQKAKRLVRDGVSRDLVFELSSSPDSSDAIAAIQAIAESGLEVYRGSDTLVFARLAHGNAELLMRNPLVISVSPRPVGELSDERQVMSLTTNLNTAGSAPTTPTGYTTWLTGRCPTCASMSPSTWRVGLADTGLDNGSEIGGHPDLAGRKDFGLRIYTGINDTCAAGNLDCDKLYHGSVVAGIMVGNASTGAIDTGGFYWGMGVAPWAGVFSTKVATFAQRTIDFAKILEITGDAANNSVTIQNHSANQYSSLDSGLYNVLARQYDIAVRDADSARTPLFISVSAGNNTQGTADPNKYRVLAGGTAKNVLSMGGVENYRPGVEGCIVDGGDDFRNILQSSRTGTLLLGYIKPDLVAPAGPIGSANSSELIGLEEIPYCIAKLPEFQVQPRSYLYNGDSGTSFAAPVGAAASLIVKRYLGATPSATSPALAKAMLIAGAKSIRGGIDKSATPDVPIEAFPNGQQGFGRISFDDIITGNTPPIWHDQAPARTFTSGTNPFRIRLRVRDASKPVKVALVWTDAPATAYVDQPLVNDLDLEVYPASIPDFRYFGNVLRVADTNKGEESFPVFLYAAFPPPDRSNNVEVVRAFMNANEEFDVQVKGLFIWGDTDGNAATFEQDFALVATNADAVNGGNPIAPVATADWSQPFNEVRVRWTSATNAMNLNYEVWRGTNLGNMQKIATTASTVWGDSNFSLNTAYVYRVVAVGNGGVSVASNNTVATTINWTDFLVIGETPIKALHWSEIRNGIDYIRTAANLSTGSWALPIASDGFIRASQLTELRTKLLEAFTALSVPAPTFTTPAPTAGVTTIKPQDVLDLRTAVE